ncbi:MAG: ABC-F family ATP-binding cassette domain-containing protein [Clostridiales bacterium]|nr:ABC-F family ATP-binding cassette domain-containing protein [Clostridiales bacterium]
MNITIQHLTYTYDGSADPVFEDLTARLDSTWRLGLTGRNGRGKTTLLRLLSGELDSSGRIHMPLSAVYFPFPVKDPGMTTMEVMRQAAPDTEDWRFICEWNQLFGSEEALERPFSTLSNGEQTKAQLCALFARDDVYPLIDEPTNHLDLHGRQQVADYLSRKDGFLLVSHDRDFLNRCIDHVMAMERAKITVMQGDYDTWEQAFDLQNESEAAQNETLRKDIARLGQSARRAAAWSANAEKGKFHVAESQVAALDRGYVGARSAAMMKRAKSIVRRREKEMAEKSKLLKNVEQVGELKLTTLRHPKQTLVSVQDGAIRYGERTVCDGIRFELRQGDRLALMGANGAGKSSVLKALCGIGNALTGSVSVASGLTVSYVPQSTEGLRGSMSQFIAANQLDETLLKAILRNMGLSREQFDRPLEYFSQGQKKKVLLAAGLCKPAHLYVWDEPLNYIDVLSRRQVEELILEYAPTLLIVEHDRMFLDKICTGVVEIG